MENYLQKEMGFVIARRHAIKLRIISVILGGIVPLGIISLGSSSSLLLLMLAAIGVRIKIKDQPIMMLPAVFYALINFLILINSTF